MTEQTLLESQAICLQTDIYFADALLETWGIRVNVRYAGEAYHFDVHIGGEDIIVYPGGPGGLPAEQQQVNTPLAEFEKRPDVGDTPYHAAHAVLETLRLLGVIPPLDEM